MPVNVTRGFWKQGPGPIIRTLSGAATQELGASVLADSNNVYVSAKTSEGAGGYDFLMVKYDLDLNLIWQKRAGDSYTNNPYGMALDSSGNTYQSGHSIVGSDYWSIFVKYDSNGSTQWGRRMLRSGYDTYNYMSKGIAVDSSGNVYVGGRGRYNTSGQADMIISKFNSSGTNLWKRYLGGSSHEFGANVGVDSSGNVYAAGATQSEGQGGTYGDIAIAKYNSSGVIQWQRTLGGTSTDQGQSMVVDGSGNVYITGNTQSEGQGNSDILIAKYNSSGVIQWQRVLGGTGGDTPIDMALDSSGNVYITGRIPNYSYFSSISTFVAKYNTSGVLQWQMFYGFPGTAGDNRVYGEGIGVDGNGDVYVTGYVSNYYPTNVMIITKINGTTPEIGISGPFESIAGTFTDSAATLTDAASTLTDQTCTTSAGTWSYSTGTTTLTDTYIGP